MKYIGPEPTFEQRCWRRVQNFAGENIVVDMWDHTVSAVRLQEFDRSHAQWLKESKIQPEIKDGVEPTYERMGWFWGSDTTGDGCLLDRFGREVKESQLKEFNDHHDRWLARKV